MYQQCAGMGFSLKPPKIVRDLVSQLISKTKVTVPTTGGTVVFTGSQTPPAQPPVQAGFMDDTSGSGNTTMLLVGAGLLALLLLKRRG